MTPRLVSRAFGLVAAFLISSFGAGFAQNMPTAADLAGRIVFAKGGESRLRAIQTERFTGTVYATESGGIEPGTFTLEQKRPNKIRLEVTLAGQTITKGFDGAIAWKAEGAKGKRTRMSPEEEALFTSGRDIDGTFLDYVKKGISLEVLDKEMLGSSQVWKLKATFKSKQIEYFYVESTGYQVLLKESEVTAGEGSAIMLQYYRDFQTSHDLIFPYTTVSIVQANDDSALTLIVQTIEINPQIEDSRFTNDSGKVPVQSNKAR